MARGLTNGLTVPDDIDFVIFFLVSLTMRDINNDFTRIEIEDVAGEDDVIPCGDRSIKILEVPGHSPNNFEPNRAFSAGLSINRQTEAYYHCKSSWLTCVLIPLYKLIHSNLPDLLTYPICETISTNPVELR